MKKVLSILSLFIIVMTVQASKTEERPASRFTAIENNCSADIMITQGSEYKIQVTTSEKYIDKVQTNIVANTLVVDVKGNIYNTDILLVEVTVIDLNEVVLHGSGNVIIKDILNSQNFILESHGSGDFRGDFNVKDMEISMHGSGDVEISGVNGDFSVTQMGSGDFEAESLHLGSAIFKMNGSGEMEISGTAAMMELSQNGSGDFDGRSLQVQTAKIRKTSSGDADVFVTENIKASVSGSGDLTIKGRPEITDFSSSGSGDIRSL